jgi:hypothetical protein
VTESSVEARCHTRLKKSLRNAKWKWYRNIKERKEKKTPDLSLRKENKTKG